MQSLRPSCWRDTHNWRAGQPRTARDIYYYYVCVHIMPAWPTNVEEINNNEKKKTTGFGRQINA